MDLYEQNFIKNYNKEIFLAGSDEVGRGCLAGPVVAASTYLNLSSPLNNQQLFKGLKNSGVSDSKLLTSAKRKKILNFFNIDISQIRNAQKYKIEIGGQKVSIYYAISELSPKIIDDINILQASLLAMKNSFVTCWDENSHGTWLIDGNQSPLIKNNFVKKVSLIKGDSKSLLIGLASIIAKEYRDTLMIKFGEKYPGHGFENHAGYPTQFHKNAIKNLGITIIHRKTFKGVKEFFNH